MTIHVLHVTGTHTLAAGGLTTAVNEIAGFALSLGHAATIFVATAAPAEVPQGASVVATAPGLGRAWLWSRGLSARMSDVVARHPVDVVHIHGCWTGPQFVAARLARRLGLPTVLSLHNFLHPWLWRKQGSLKRWKKELYWRLVAEPVFRKVDIVHAITPAERDTLSQFLGECDIRVIPNSIDTAVAEQPLLGCGPIRPDRSILCLGRIHPVKGVDLLLEAFARLPAHREWRVVLAGPADDPAYVRRLSALAERLGIAQFVQWLGPVYGSDKFALIRRSWIVCVPSHTEVIGMVNLEAAACRVPTVTTDATGLTEWPEHGGFLADGTIGSLSERLAQALTMSEEERARRGEMLRRLVETKFSSSVIKERWQELYAAAIEKSRRRSKARRD